MVIESIQDFEFRLSILRPHFYRSSPGYNKGIIFETRMLKTESVKKQKRTIFDSFLIS